MRAITIYFLFLRVTITEKYAGRRLITHTVEERAFTKYVFVRCV
jgi:hypothetical protein